MTSKLTDIHSVVFEFYLVPHLNSDDLYSLMKTNKSMLKLVLDFIIRHKKIGGLLLIYSVTENIFFISEFLIKAGADIEKQNEEGETALMIACKFGYTKTVKFLIEAGADIEKQKKILELMMELRH